MNLSSAYKSRNHDLLKCTGQRFGRTLYTVILNTLQDVRTQKRTGGTVAMK